MSLGHAAVALAVAGTLAAPPPEGPAQPPGGYWDLGEKREPEPKDGQTNLTVGAILLPLGLLRSGAGAVNVYTTTGDRCARIYGFDPEDCSSFRAYGWWGVGFGGLMAVTGAVFLGIGFKQRAEHNRWKRRYGIALRTELTPMLGRGEAGAALKLRF